MEDRQGGQTAGSIGVEAHAISTLSSPFSDARHLWLIEVSSATGVRIIASQKLKRSLSAGEIRSLGKVPAQMEREGKYPSDLAAIRVMLPPASAAWKCWRCARNGCSATTASSASRAPNQARGCALPAIQRFAIRLSGRLGGRPLHRHRSRLGPYLQSGGPGRGNAPRPSPQLRQYGDRARVK